MATNRVPVVLTMRQAELLWSAGLRLVEDEAAALELMSRADYNATWRALEKLRASVRMADERESRQRRGDSRAPSQG